MTRIVYGVSTDNSQLWQQVGQCGSYPPHYLVTNTIKWLRRSHDTAPGRPGDHYVTCTYMYYHAYIVATALFPLVSTHTKCMELDSFIDIHSRVFKYIYIYIFMCTYIFLCIYIHKYIYMFEYIEKEIVFNTRITFFRVSCNPAIGDSMHRTVSPGW